MSFSVYCTFLIMQTNQPAAPRPAELDRELRRFAEEVGVLFEAQGHTRMEGRIVGRLLVADPPVQSMTALSEYLGVSKASVSAATRVLVQTGAIERVSLPGDRRDYFRLRTDFLDGVLHESIAAMTRFRSLLERALQLVSGDDQPHAALIDTRDFYEFFERELTDVLQRWQAQRRATP